LPQAKVPAFPGAEGGGMYSFGGRGGRVIVVTSLNDEGPGTLRDACEQAGPRVVVFNVAGIIHLDSRIRVRAPYISIEGQSAPGDGICISGATFAVDTHDVVIRFLRFRRGETNVANRDDSLGGNPIGNIIIDHVSASWGLDENLSMYRHMYGGEYHSLGAGTRATHTNAQKLPTCNITIQWSISSEALNTYNHAFGSTIGGRNSTFHHDLWACNTGRNPSIGMNYEFNAINNVIFNWRHRTMDGGDNTSLVNVINNYYKPGPITDTTKPIGHRIVKPEAMRGKNAPRLYGKYYVAGNVVEGDDAVTKDNWDGGVQFADANEAIVGEPKDLIAAVRVDKPFPMAPVTIQSAKDAYDAVLASAGATLPKRDPVDTRIIEEVRTGKVPYDQGIITDIKQVGGYPEYKGEPYKDNDHDGMPDEWETAHGLNPNDALDASKDSGDGYTNIEKFLNSLAAKP
jgi:hypothetical protein